MNVLMVNTPDSQRFRGGDLVQMRKTAEALKPLGVHTSVSFEPEPELQGFDLAHVFNLRTIEVTLRQVQHIRKAGLPIVLSPIYLNPSLAMWASGAISDIFGNPRPEDQLQRLLANLGSYRIRFKLANGRVVRADASNRPCEDYDDQQRLILKQVDHLLPNSLLEVNQLIKTLRICDIPFTVVPYAADPAVFLDTDPIPFVRAHGLRDFVLQVGRIELSKNQLLLVYALRQVRLPVVLIGGNLQPLYLDWCRTYGPPDLKIIDHLPTDQLASAYAAARVHVLPSWIETCGLVTMEAALANCSVVTSIVGHELDYYRDLAYYCDPADVNSIRDSVLKAYENYDRDAQRRLRLKTLILTEFTWERAAEKTFSAYRSVLNAR